VLGDGPDRDKVLAEIERAGDFVEAPGFVETEEVERSLARALCLLLPSRREGYGLIVVEALSLGTPCVLVRDPDNAATELIEDGVNGFIAHDASPEALGAAIVRVHEAGAGLRASAADWYARHAGELALDASLDAVAASYAASARA
jgi:glycosyltransferase involved in cell wall biosynthesis